MTHESYPSAADVILRLDNGITVRRLRNEDAASLSKHANNKNIFANLRDRFPNPYTVEAAQFWIDFNSDPRNQIPSGEYVSGKTCSGPAVPTHYAIVVDGEACGGIGVEFGQDIYFRTAELGYWLSESQWGKGVMSRVVPAFVKWVWQTFGILVRLNGQINEGNVGSRKLLERAGFLFEGRRPNAVCKEGKVAAELMFGALRPESA